MASHGTTTSTLASLLHLLLLPGLRASAWHRRAPQRRPPSSEVTCAERAAASVHISASAMAQLSSCVADLIDGPVTREIFRGCPAAWLYFFSGCLRLDSRLYILAGRNAEGARIEMALELAEEACHFRHVILPSCWKREARIQYARAREEVQTL